MNASPVAPSFVAKLGRAKKHLADLEDAVDAYAATKPYAVTERGERQNKQPIRRLQFTADPANTDIPLIAADAIYNLRASLDHLMSALAPRKKRRGVMFPIYWRGVWEPPVEGENEQRSKDRARWVSDTKTLPDGAVAILKRLQPPDGAGDGENFHTLKVVNALSNTDRHTKLPVFAAGLRSMELRWELPDGIIEYGGGSASPDAFTEDNAAVFGIPDRAVNVQIEGTPFIAVRVTEKRRKSRERYSPIPEDLCFTARFIERDIFPKLIPFVRTDG